MRFFLLILIIFFKSIIESFFRNNCYCLMRGIWSLRHWTLFILEISLIRFNTNFLWVYNFNRFDPWHLFDISFASTYFLLLNLFLWEHHRHSSLKYHVKSVSIVAMFVHEIPFLEILIFQILNHLKQYLFLQILVLKEVYVAKEFIDLVLVYLLQRDFHLTRYNFDNAVDTVSIVGVFIEIERGKSLLLGENKFAVDDDSSTHRFFSQSFSHQISPSHHSGCALLWWI